MIFRIEKELNGKVVKELKGILQLLNTHTASVRRPECQVFFIDHTVDDHYCCFFDHHVGIHENCVGLKCNPEEIKPHLTTLWKQQMMKLKQEFMLKVRQ